jgi:TRAP-type C4-dicarboxylate transport system permease small subunit
MIRKVIQSITLYLSYVGMFFLIPMMLLTSGEVIGRAIWSWPIPGSMELSSYMLAVFILLGVAYTHQVKGHVRVTMLISRLPQGVALVLEIMTTLLSLFIIAIMAWQGWVVGMEERTVSDMLRIPQFPFRLLVSVAGLFLCLELLLDLTDSLKKLVRR